MRLALLRPGRLTGTDLHHIKTPPLCRQRNAQGHSQRGFTLLEMLLVSAILIVLAALVIPLLGNLRFSGAGRDRTAQQVATAATLAAVRDAILGTPAQPGLWQDLGERTNYFPQTIADLFRPSPRLPKGLQSFNPVTRLGWRGPYLSSSDASYAVNSAKNFTTAYGNTGDPTIPDAWGRPIILQVPQVAGASHSEEALNARLVSAGPDGIIQTPINKLAPSNLTTADRGDDVILFLSAPDPQ